MKLKRKKIIFYGLIVIGIIFYSLFLSSNDFLFCFLIAGGIGKVIAGEYSFTPSSLRGKVITGIYTWIIPPYPKGRVICGQYGKLKNKCNPNIIIS